jgi:mono/diheme cytochrome c family protein
LRFKAFILYLFILSASSLHAGSLPASPDTLSKGEAVFRARCVSCHGEKAVGTDKGPPLVHKFYRPDHHADITFRWAVERGVRAHHWAFGDMPRIEGVSKDEVELLITYIRDLQKKAGIY